MIDSVLSKSMMHTYLEQLASLRGALEDSFQTAVAGPIAAEDQTITKSILLSVKSYYDSRYGVCEFLDKGNIGSGADFMVEAILFHLKAFLESRGSALIAKGEVTLRPTRARPDISVWLEGAPVAAIECKTTLGWNRTEWEKSFLNREELICSQLPDLKCYLVVFSAQDAPGVEGNAHFGARYFILSRQWPHKIDASEPEKDIVSPIEPLFLEIAAIGQPN